MDDLIISIVEFITSWGIVLLIAILLVIFSVSTGSKEKGLMAGIAVGAVVGLEALFAGPISGASMNPARSLAPALLAGKLDGLWIYLLAPALGALIAVPVCWCTQSEACCRPAAPEEPASC